MPQEGRQAVGYIGMDVRNREGHVCPPDEGGAVVLEQRIRTERRRFAAVLGEQPRARILLFVYPRARSEQLTWASILIFWSPAARP